MANPAVRYSETRDGDRDDEKSANEEGQDEENEFYSYFSNYGTIATSNFRTIANLNVKCPISVQQMNRKMSGILN